MSQETAAPKAPEKQNLDRIVDVMCVAAGDPRNPWDNGIPMGIHIDTKKLGRKEERPFSVVAGASFEVTLAELVRLKKWHPSVAFVHADPAITTWQRYRQKLADLGPEPEKSIARYKKAGMEADAERIERVLKEHKQAEKDAKKAIANEIKVPE